MFADNRKFSISCDLDVQQISPVIDLGIQLSGWRDALTRDHKPTKLMIQETEDKIVIGHNYEAAPGWEKLPFDYDPDILAEIVLQKLKKLPYTQERLGYDSQDTGVLCRDIGELSCDERQQIASREDAILIFSLCTHWYSK